VLLTGHTGFKGAWLALWLQSLGAHVTGFSLDPPSRPSLYQLARVADGLESLEGDVRDHAAVIAAVAQAEPEVLVHMAAQSLVGRSFEQPRATYETNVMGTVNILDAVRVNGSVRVVVNVTSDKCYESRATERGHSEHDPMGGGDPYSSSKGCAELVTAAFRQSFFLNPQAARVASARAGNVIGGGDWAVDRLVPDIMRAALADQPVRVRSPNSIRPWQHVLNPLSGYLMLAQALWDEPEYATAWNFGPDEVRSVRWLVERLGELWPQEVRWEPDEEVHIKEARSLRLDSSRAQAHLGWRPLVDLETALGSVVEWNLALRGGADMRAITLRQIETLLSPRGA
jgi:CDP-glucose 4,6-dehydratase